MTLPITSSAPSVFSSAPPVPPRKDDDDDAPSFRQVMTRAARGDAPRPRDDRESIETDRGGQRGADRAADHNAAAQPDDDHDAAQVQDAQSQSAQQIAMQALALAGMTPSTPAINAAGPNQQLDALSQLNALAGVAGNGLPQGLGNGIIHGLVNGLGNGLPGGLGNAALGNAALAATMTDATATTASTTPGAQVAPPGQPTLTAPPTKPAASATTAIDPRLAALLGAMQSTAPTPATPAIAAAATAKTTQPAVTADTALTAAIHRATAALHPAAASATATVNPADAAAAATKAAAVLAAAGDSPSTTALTPLEQAVHDLIGQLGDQKHAGKAKADDADPLADVTSDPTASQTALGQLATQPASPHAVPATSRAAELDPTRPAAVAQPADAPSNPSHVHLVLDDGPDRVVVTVAVRGNDIHVALRGNDDATTNALARNAATLDHAMRARGLQLSQLTAEREPAQPDSQRQNAEREPRQGAPKDGTKRFVLEENL